MSLSIANGVSSVTFDGSAGYALYGEVSRRLTGVRRITRDAAYVVANPYVGQTLGGELEWTLERVRITGSDADDLATKLRALNSILTGEGTATDSLPGGSYSATWAMNPSEPILPGHNRYTGTRSAWEGRVVFYTAPLGEGSAIDLYTAEPVTCPGLLPLGALYGDAPAALDVEVDAGWGIRSCYVGLVPGDAVIGDYLWQAEDASGWTLCTETDAGPGASDNARKRSNAAWGALTFTAPAAGRYRVIARARRTLSKTGYLGLSEDGTNAYQTTTLDGADYRLYDLGEFAADGQITLYVLGKGTDAVYLDYVCLFPTEDGIASLADASPSPASWQLTESPTTTDGSANVYPAARYMTGGQLVCPCASRQLLIAICDTSGTEESPSVDVSVSYTPRYYTWSDA